MPVVVRDSLPNPRTGHTWTFIAFRPDDLLYMPVGAPCSVCLSPPLVSTIVRMKPDGSNLEVFAEGVRNSVGFDGSALISDDMGNRLLRVSYRR